MADIRLSVSWARTLPARENSLNKMDAHVLLIGRRVLWVDSTGFHRTRRTTLYTLPAARLRAYAGGSSSLRLLR